MRCTVCKPLRLYSFQSQYTVSHAYHCIHHHKDIAANINGNFNRWISDQEVSGFTSNKPCEPTVQFTAYPLTKKLSFWLRPWAFSTLTELMGYLATPLLSTNFTARVASTTMSAKKSASLRLWVKAKKAVALTGNRQKQTVLILTVCVKSSSVTVLRAIRIHSNDLRGHGSLGCID